MHDLAHDLAGWTIVFDLDGTLVDTAPDLVGSLNTVLTEQGLPPAPMSAVRLLVGHGVRHLLRTGFGLAGEAIDEDRIDALRPRFIEVYRGRIALESRPFPGCLEALAALRGRGAALAVCTNKPHGLAMRLLDELGVADRFDAVIGGDVLPVQKPDPLHLLEAIRRAGGEPQRAILVGDGAPDVGAALAAGVPCIVCEFGYNEVPAEDMGGDTVISGYGDLARAVTAMAVR